MILVTGATGLVGSHLILHLLENGENVRAIYHTSQSTAKTKSLFRLHQKEHLFEKISWVAADITDVPSLSQAFANIQYVYHCAALVSFDPNDEKLLRKINIEGTANIVNLCLEFNVKKICHISSIAALGDLKPGETVVDENTEWNPEAPHSDYAISKHGAEMEIWRGQQEGLAVAIINPGVIIGPGFWTSGSGAIFTRVSRGLRYYTKGVTGFVGVDDVVKIACAAMKSNRSGEQYIAVSEILTFENMLKMVATSLKVKAPAIHAKPWLTSIFWRADWILSGVFMRKPKLSRMMAHSLHSIDHYSSEKTKRELSFSFRGISEVIIEVGTCYKKRL